MLKKSLRLNRSDFETINGNKRLTNAFFSCTYSPILASGFGKTAVVVSKKIAPKSVARHLLKRRIIHALSTFPKRKYNLAVYARSGSAKLTYNDILNELFDLVKKIS